MQKIRKLVTRGRARATAIVASAVALAAMAMAATAGAEEVAPKYSTTIEPLTKSTQSGFLEVVPPVLAVLATLIVIALIVTFARKQFKKA